MTEITGVTNDAGRAHVSICLNASVVFTAWNRMTLSSLANMYHILVKRFILAFVVGTF